MRLFFILPALFLFGSRTAAQQPDAFLAEPVSIATEMRGYDAGRTVDLSSGSFQSRLSPVLPQAASRKNPVLAGLFSLIIPGAGEIYAGNYLLAALFATLEGVGWYYSIDATRKGDAVTEVYHDYADANWSVVKYAQWLNENAKNYAGGENAVHIDISSDENLPAYQRVNWDQMHTTEMAIPVFSHRLPPYGDQQYYELIGKYNQYSYGWNDKTEGDYWNPSSNFMYYSGLRGDANRHYDASSTIVSLLIVNHFLSAVDAAWAAARFNKVIELQSGARLQRLPDGRTDLVTSARLSFRF